MPAMTSSTAEERRTLRQRLSGGLFSSLRHRAFTLVWAGQFASRIGDNVYRVALAWWVLDKTGSPAAMGTVLISSFTPMLLFVLLGGVVVDRISRLRVMFWADVVRGVVTLAVAAAAFSGTLEIWHVYLASIVFGFAAAFFQPAFVAVVPEVTPREHLPSANSITALSQQVATVGGPAIGAGCIALGGSALGFALNGFSFLIAAGCLMGLSWRSFGGRPESVRPSIFGDIREGLVTVRDSTWLWATIALAALGNLALTGPMQIALPFLLKEERGESATAFGLFLSFASVGSVAVAIILGRATRIRKRGLLAYAGLIGNGIMLVALGQDVPVAWLWVAGLFGGAALMLFDLIWINTIQELVPPQLLGRVFSVDQLGSFALMPLGFAFTGWATDRFGAAEVLVASGGVLVLLPLVGLLSPAVRRLD